MAPHSSFRPFVFLELPREIRDQVYEELLQPARDLCSPRVTNDARTAQRLKGSTKVLHLCRQINNEASAILLQVPKTFFSTPITDDSSFPTHYVLEEHVDNKANPGGFILSDKFVRIFFDHSIRTGLTIDYYEVYWRQGLELALRGILGTLSRTRALTRCHLHIDAGAHILTSPSQLRTTLQPLVHFRANDLSLTLCFHGWYRESKPILYGVQSAERNAKWLQNWFMKARVNAEKAAGNTNSRSRFNTTASVVYLDDPKKTGSSTATAVNTNMDNACLIE